MSNTHDTGEDPTVRALETELRIVGDAIALVESGGSPRVVLGGLQFVDQLLEAAHRMALGTGVRIVPLWTADEAGLDLSVERDRDA